MSTESENESQGASSMQQPGDLKASDFFPPGSGWNKAAKPDIVDHGRKPDANQNDPQHSRQN